MSKQQQRQAVFFRPVVDQFFSVLHDATKAEKEEFFHLEKKGSRIVSSELDLDALYAIFLDEDGGLLPEFRINGDELDIDLLEFMMDDILRAVEDVIPEKIWENLGI